MCGENLHRVLVASLIYAESFNTKLPPWRAGSAGMNNMSAGQYSRWAYSSGVVASYYVEKSFTQPFLSSFHNTGYLYAGNLVDDGSVLYCPSLISGQLSAAQYSPLFTTDGGGAIRSSYNYNPRMVNWDSNLGLIDTNRRYLTTSQFEPHKVFGNDVVSGAYAHGADQGYNAVFTDGSVKFCRTTTPLAAQLANAARTDSDYASREQLYDLFEGM